MISTARIFYRRVAGPTCVAVLMTAGCGTADNPGAPPTVAGSVPTRPTLVPGTAILAGRILDAEGEGVPSATVAVAETDAVVTATATGDYQITVPADSTVTLVARAAGLATTFRDSILVASQATIADFDLILLRPEKVAAINALGAPGQESTRGAMAVRLRSLEPGCTAAGAKVTVWPPLAAKVVYSQVATTSGALDEPNASLEFVGSGPRTDFWLAATFPPGNGLTIDVQQAGCRVLAQSPSMDGVIFTGQRHVVAQALTQVDLFLGAAQ